MTTERPNAWAQVAAACSAAAALVHAAAAGTHGDQQQLVRLFTLTAAAQAAVAVALLLSRSRKAAAAAIVVNGGAFLAWALSRTTGIQAIDVLAGREPVGTQDLTAALLALAATGTAALALRAGAEVRAGRGPSWLPGAAMGLALVPAVIGVAAPHAHEAGDDHSHGTELAAGADDAATAGDHSHGTGAAAPTGAGHEHEDASGLAADPKLAGADTSTATEAELTAALDLIDATRAGRTVTTITTTEEAEAAGYVWIGDGRRVGGFQHYVSPAAMADGAILDPDAVESLVFENTGDGPVLVSAMYLLEPGSTMDDLPEVAGDLTVWHDHQNLCWDPSGTRLAGVVVDGECRPGGVQRGTTPMLHVWLTDHECGPFAGIEGHGEGCAHEH